MRNQITTRLRIAVGVISLAACAAATAEVKVSDSGNRGVKSTKGQEVVFRDVGMDTGKVAFLFRMGNGVIGMRRPSPANFHQGGFFYVGAGKSRFFRGGKYVSKDEFKEPFDLNIEQADDAAELIATQKQGDVAVEVRLRAEDGADHVKMTISVTGQKPKDPMAIRFITYPSYFVRKGGHKLAILSSGRTEEFVDRKAGPKAKLEPTDHWVYLRDKTLDGKKKAGVGIQWNPAEIQSWRLNLRYYATNPVFVLKTPRAGFTLFDFEGKTPEEALARMKQLARPAE